MNGQFESIGQQISKESLKLGMLISRWRLRGNIDVDSVQPSRPFNLKVLHAVCNSDHALQR
jgi:hypothetical protein